MTTPLVGKAFLTVLLALGASSSYAGGGVAGPAVKVQTTGSGFAGLPFGQQVDFAQSLNRISMQALGLGSALGQQGGVPQLTVKTAGAPEAAAMASAGQVMSFLATSPGETETEFRARRAALGALWAEDKSYANGLVQALSAVKSPEARKAVEALQRLVEVYRPAVQQQKGRLAHEIPSVSRLEEMGSFEDVGSLFENATRRTETVPDGVAVDHPGQLELFSREDMERMAGAHLAKAMPGQRQGEGALRDVPALAPNALAAANDAPGVESTGMMGMMGKAKGTMKEHKHHIMGYLGMIGIAAPTLGGIFMWGGTGGVFKAAAAAAASHAVLGPLGLLLLQAFVIIGVGKLMGMLLSKIGQPSVIGQVLGGLLLGPSVLGALFPGMMTGLFPKASLAFLDPLSQFGLIFFMFIVGLELDTKLLKKQGGAAGLVSHASIIFPFILGAALALVLFTGYAPVGVPFHVFALFMGISMSITAFPVLASILKEKKLIKTPLGALALTSAAVDDATAWPLLAFVVAVAASGGGLGTGPMLGLSVAFMALMFGVVKPLLKKWVSRLTPEQAKEPSAAAIPVLLVILSALATEMIGIHALFGAFIAGVIIPRESMLRHNMEKWLGPFSQLILLPIFFALTGLRTQLSLLGGMENLLITALIIAVAMLGKLGGATAAAKFSGLGWRDSLSIGALMNTRGLMELIVLNIGYSLGVLSPTLFAMLVVMAVVTTFITSPLLGWINRGRSKADSSMLEAPAHS